MSRRAGSITRRFKGIIRKVILGSPIRTNIMRSVFGETIVEAVGNFLKEDGDNLLLETGDNLLLEG